MFIAMWLFIALFILIWSIISFFKGLKEVFPTRCWLVQKKDADKNMPQYLRLKKKVTVSDLKDCMTTFQYNYFEPNGTIESSWYSTGVLNDYVQCEINYSQKLERSFLNQLYEDDQREIKEREEMQKKALEAFLQKGGQV